MGFLTERQAAKETIVVGFLEIIKEVKFEIFDISSPSLFSTWECVLGVTP